MKFFLEEKKPKFYRSRLSGMDRTPLTLKVLWVKTNRTFPRAIYVIQLYLMPSVTTHMVFLFPTRKKMFRLPFPLCRQRKTIKGTNQRDLLALLNELRDRTYALPSSLRALVHHPEGWDSEDCSIWFYFWAGSPNVITKLPREGVWAKALLRHIQAHLSLYHILFYNMYTHTGTHTHLYCIHTYI